MSCLLALAFGAGLLAPVNPCGFALLPAYLTTFMQPRTGDPPPSVGWRLRRALSTGLAVTLGFSATLTAVCVALAAGLRALTEVIPWPAVAVGVILTVADVVMLSGRDRIQRHGLDQVVDELVLSCEMGVAKPDAGFYRLALTRLGVTARATLLVDDTVGHVAAARRLGMAGHVHRHTPGTVAAMERFRTRSAPGPG